MADELLGLVSGITELDYLIESSLYRSVRVAWGLCCVTTARTKELSLPCFFVNRGLAMGGPDLRLRCLSVVPCVAYFINHLEIFSAIRSFFQRNCHQNRRWTSAQHYRESLLEDCIHVCPGLFFWLLQAAGVGWLGSRREFSPSTVRQMVTFGLQLPVTVDWNSLSIGLINACAFWYQITWSQRTIQLKLVPSNSNYRRCWWLQRPSGLLSRDRKGHQIPIFYPIRSNRERWLPHPRLSRPPDVFDQHKRLTLKTASEHLVPSTVAALNLDRSRPHRSPVAADYSRACRWTQMVVVCS